MVIFSISQLLSDPNVRIFHPFSAGFGGGHWVDNKEWQWASVKCLEFQMCLFGRFCGGDI